MSNTIKYKDFFHEEINKLTEIRKNDIKSDNMSIPESIDVPPIVNTHSHFSPSFIEYIKHVENGVHSGFKNGMWYPMPSPEGGNATIAYGHKLKNSEIKEFSNGITDEYAEKLLLHDLALAKKTVYSDIKSMAGVQIPLDARQEEMLTDFAFNLSTLKGFPKFVKAVLNNDENTIAHEYKRTFKDIHGKRKDLARNTVFFNRYLKENMENKDIDEKFPTVIKQGLIDDGIFGYELKSDYSNIRYGHNPHQKIFYLYNIWTPQEEHKNQGHARELLDYFFQIVKMSHGRLNVDSYTTSGLSYVKPMIDRLSKQYNIKLV